MILNLSHEDREALEPVAKVEALAFLQTRLDAVEAKIDRYSAYLEQTYPEGETPPRGQPHP